ncbi:MAG: OmcA/MtrC family decaheme c-type cytochrome, partial [Gammaproteobacteria bacterium]|nr:OmcA/MtrC family decaheme c-type cytochrome [Gammaproteobacteria bacterium]
MEYSNTVILRKIKFFLATALVATALSGCDGDDGERGATGATGAPPPPTTSSAESLNITIDSATISSSPVVELSVSDEDGIPFTGISDGDLRFTFAKLVPGTNGDPSFWQSYINREETAIVGPGTGNTTVQATSERNVPMVNHGDGTYTYTFATDITNVTTPLAVSYEPTLTHRFAIQVGGGLPVSNPTFTFRPSDGMTTGIVTRDIVKIESCNECHNALALHGGGRVDTQLCVTCHNPGSTDANSGNTVDFKVMIHKIHRGEDLPSVVAGGEYSIYGFRDTKHDFSDVALPQNIRHCTKCHDGSDPDTPEGDNWKTQLSIVACGSCHDDIDFSKDGSGSPPVDPTGHPGGIVSDNTECITCHATGRIARSVEETHILAGPVVRTKFKLNILEICGTLVDTDP